MMEKKREAPPKEVGTRRWRAQLGSWVKRWAESKIVATRESLVATVRSPRVGSGDAVAASSSCAHNSDKAIMVRGTRCIARKVGGRYLCTLI